MAKKKSSKKTRQTANRIAASKGGAPGKQRAGKAGSVVASSENEALNVEKTGDHETVTGNHETVTGDHETVTGDRETVTGDRETVTGDHETVTGDHETITAYRETVTGDHETITADRETVTGDHETITADRETISGDHETITADRETITGDHETITADRETITGDHETVAADHEPVTASQEPAPTNNETAANEKTPEVPFVWTRPQDYFGLSASNTFQGMQAAVQPAAASVQAEDVTRKRTDSGGAFAKIKSKLASLAPSEPGSLEESGDTDEQPKTELKQAPEQIIAANHQELPMASNAVAEYERASSGALGSPMAPESGGDSSFAPESSFVNADADISAQQAAQQDLRPITPKIAKYIANLADSIVAQRQGAEPPPQKKNFDWKEAEALLKGMTETKAEELQPQQPHAPKSAAEPIGNKPPQFPLAEEHQLRPRFQRTVDPSKIAEKSEALSGPSQAQPPSPQPPAPPQPNKSAISKSESAPIKARKGEEPANDSSQKKSVQDLRESIISQGEGTPDDWHPVEKAKKKLPKDFVPAIEALQKLPPDFGFESKPKAKSDIITNLPKHHSLEELASMDPSLVLPPPSNQQQSIRRLKSHSTAGLRFDFILLVYVACLVVGFGCQLVTPKTFIEPGRTVKAAVQSIMPIPLSQTFNQGMKMYDEQAVKTHSANNKNSAPLRLFMAPLSALLYTVPHIWKEATEKADPLSTITIALEFLSLFLLAYISYVKVRRRATYGILECLWLPIPLIVLAAVWSVPTSYLFEGSEKICAKVMPDTIVFFTTLSCIICVLDEARRSFFVRKPALDPRD